MKKDSNVCWKAIEGYMYPYRVSDQGEVQKQEPNGKWRSLKPSSYRGAWKVHMVTKNGKFKNVAVSKLVVDAFLGGTPKGKCRVHKNGMRQDNAIENLVFMTQSKNAKRTRPWNCRPVVKIDDKGEVVEVYRSATEAAKKNYISHAAMTRMCRGEILKPYQRYGYNFKYEDTLGRRKKL